MNTACQSKSLSLIPEFQTYLTRYFMNQTLKLSETKEIFRALVKHVGRNGINEQFKAHLFFELFNMGTQFDLLVTLLNHLNCTVPNSSFALLATEGVPGRSSKLLSSNNLFQELTPNITGSGGWAKIMSKSRRDQTGS